MHEPGGRSNCQTCNAEVQVFEDGMWRLTLLLVEKRGRGQPARYPIEVTPTPTMTRALDAIAHNDGAGLRGYIKNKTDRPLVRAKSAINTAFNRESTAALKASGGTDCDQKRYTVKSVCMVSDALSSASIEQCPLCIAGDVRVKYPITSREDMTKRLERGVTELCDAVQKGQKEATTAAASFGRWFKRTVDKGQKVSATVATRKIFNVIITDDMRRRWVVRSDVFDAVQDAVTRLSKGRPWCKRVTQRTVDDLWAARPACDYRLREAYLWPISADDA